MGNHEKQRNWQHWEYKTQNEDNKTTNTRQITKKMVVYYKSSSN